LSAGAERVVLYTDLANPTSNSIYQRGGYRPPTHADPGADPNAGAGAARVARRRPNRAGRPPTEGTSIISSSPTIDTIALWCLHAWALDAFDLSPRLVFVGRRGWMVDALLRGDTPDILASRAAALGWADAPPAAGAGVAPGDLDAVAVTAGMALTSAVSIELSIRPSIQPVAM